MNTRYKHIYVSFHKNDQQPISAILNRTYARIEIYLALAGGERAFNMLGVRYFDKCPVISGLTSVYFNINYEYTL